MEPYLFSGIVLPERAQLSSSFSLGFSHLTSGVTGEIEVKILLNQIAAWVQTDHAWDIFDLRNVVKSVVQNHLAMVGYLRGFAYDFEITRVLSPTRGIDHVFGIDIPCLAERATSLDPSEALAKLLAKTSGAEGIFLQRCFNDLVSAIKHADDTAFYCYRAIESLRHHCAAMHNMTDASKPKQWKKFHAVAGCTEDALMQVKAAADPLRHGKPTGITSDDRANLLTATWRVVDGYLHGIGAFD